MPRDPLFSQIRKRRTHKGAYDDARVVPAPLWAQFASSARDLGLLAGEVTDPARARELRGLTRASFETEMTTPRT